MFLRLKIHPQIGQNCKINEDIIFLTKSCNMAIKKHGFSARRVDNRSFTLRYQNVIVFTTLLKIF